MPAQLCHSVIDPSASCLRLTWLTPLGPALLLWHQTESVSAKLSEIKELQWLFPLRLGFKG